MKRVCETTSFMLVQTAPLLQKSAYMFLGPSRAKSVAQLNTLMVLFLMKSNLRLFSLFLQFTITFLHFQKTWAPLETFFVAICFSGVTFNRKESVKQLRSICLEFNPVLQLTKIWNRTWKDFSCTTLTWSRKVSQERRHRFPRGQCCCSRGVAVQESLVSRSRFSVSGVVQSNPTMTVGLTITTNHFRETHIFSQDLGKRIGYIPETDPIRSSRTTSALNHLELARTGPLFSRNCQ